MTIHAGPWGAPPQHPSARLRDDVLEDGEISLGAVQAIGAPMAWMVVTAHPELAAALGDAACTWLVARADSAPDDADVEQLLRGALPRLRPTAHQRADVTATLLDYTLRRDRVRRLRRAGQDLHPTLARALADAIRNAGHGAEADVVEAAIGTALPRRRPDAATEREITLSVVSGETPTAIARRLEIDAGTVRRVIIERALPLNTALMD